MAADEFNSLGGYSVNIPPITVIDENGNVVTNVLVPAGNVAAARIYAANYFYANGVPFNAGGIPYGPNNSVQFNSNGAFDGSANFTFNNITQLLTVPSINVSGLANLGNLGNITITGGNAGYLLTTSGNGVLNWTPPSTGSAISNGTSNLNIDTVNGNIVAGVNGVANVFSITSQGATTFGNVTAGNIKSDNLLYANGVPYVFTTNAAGSNTQVQFNNNNAFSASANFTFNNTTNTLTVTNIVSNGAGLSNITGANVTGQVGYAAVANSVAVANVVGIGNIATINLDGNVSNILHGDGSWGAEAGNLNANFANFAGNVTGSSQPNITSLGTLVDLAVAGNANITGNLLTQGTIVSNANITGANLITSNGIYANTATITANLTSGNANLGNLATANYINVSQQLNGNVANFSGNLTSLNANLGNLATANYINVSQQINGNTANFSGNLTALNANLGNLATANYINVSQEINGNTANFSGNITSLNANLGNLVTANYVNVSQQINGNVANFSGNLTALNANLGNLVTANYVNVSSNLIASNLTVNLELSGNTANFTGNITSLNANLGNLVTANYVNVSSNIITNNLTINLELSGNVANFSGNITSLNANLGNLVTANYVNVSQQINGNVANFSGNLTAGNATLGNLATANYINVSQQLNGNVANFSGNLTSGNANLGNLATANYFTGTLTTNAQPNITSVGTLTSLNVSGNVNTGNLGTNNFIATGTGSFSANLNMNNQHINNLGYPNLSTDAASKAYVDTMVSTGIAYHQPVYVATTTTLAVATGGTTSYVSPNGAANGIGAYISTTGTYLNIDSANVQTVGTRILVKDESNAAWNGVYTYANTTAIVRATDADQYGPDSTEQLSINDYFFTTNGVINEGYAFIVSSPAGTIVFGTSDITFSIFSGSQVYDAGTGLTLTGTTFSVNNAQPQITSLGTLTGLTSNGTVNFSNAANVTLGNVTNVHISGGTAGYLLGTDGSGNLSWISGGNISGVIGNSIILGTPSDGDLTTNVAYNGWTTGTYVTDGLDDLNQVSLNIAGNTFVGNIYITANTTSGPSPLTVAFTGNYIGNPTNYLWNFGDGTTSNVRNPTKTYSNTSGGQFTVSFTAFNVNGTYGGNAANGAKGSTATSTNTNYITLFTPLPIPSFTTSPTSLDTGSAVTLTNTSLYATSYTINYGDGNSAVNPGNSWTTNSHTYTTSANVDTIYGINLTGTNQTAGNAPPYSVTTANTNVKVYAPQSPAFSSNAILTINYLATSGGVISFRNDTPGSPGNTASFGAQQLYNYRWGDGTANSNINIQTGLAGNPGAANITHAFALSSVQQNAATTVSYVTNLSLYTGYSTSPFISSNITITVEPEVRANFTGTANTQTDASGYSSNAQVGYLYTDYLGRDRSLFNFSNDTSPNVNFTGNVFNWTWGDTTSNTGLTSRANISHSYLNDYGSPTTGGKTVTLQANGTPGTILQSNTNTKTNYITILPNPTAPPNLSSYTNVTIATSSQGTSPLLAAGANDNTGGNIVANGTSVTRVATTTPVSTNTQVTNANTSLTGTLTAYVNNTAAGNTSFSNIGNAVGTYSSLVVSADRDLHIANAAVPTGFYKVFSATISNTLASLGNGYNDFQLRHSTTGNTNTIGMVKDNLNSVPTLVTTNIAMVTSTSGTYRYISGIPYYSATGSPAITIANLELQNFTGQTFRSADPFTVASGTVYEGSGSVISTQTKTLAQIDNSANSMLTGSNVKANIGISTNYTMGNLNVLINGAVNGVSTIAANIFNVVGTSTTIQLPTKIQMYAGANSGFNEQSIPANVASNTQAAIRVVLSSAGNTPAFSGSINYYTSNAWTGAQTIAGTPEAVVRYGVLKHYAVDLSTGYLPAGPDLATGRSGLQYFTLAFVRPSLANFDIILTTGSTGISGLWVAAPGTTIDTGGFSAPTAGAPGPTSTINGWLTGYEQYNGAGVPGNSATGGNPAGTNGCALTGADVIPLNTQISNSRYTMTLGSQNQANSFGNNILIRIALAAGQTITDLQIGVAT